jgi:hypothetical protein
MKNDFLFYFWDFRKELFFEKMIFRNRKFYEIGLNFSEKISHSSVSQNE